MQMLDFPHLILLQRNHSETTTGPFEVLLIISFMVDGLKVDYYQIDHQDKPHHLDHSRIQILSATIAANRK